MRIDKQALLAAVLAVAVCAVPTSALADLTPVVTMTIAFDEDGHGSGALENGLTWTLQSEKVTDPWGLRVAYRFNLDPTVFQKALTYSLGSPPGMLPPSLVAGDVLLFAPNYGFSDIIRFNYGANGSPPFGTIVVYSDGTNSYDSWADVPRMSLPWNLGNAIWLPKQGEEGSWSGYNGYTPQGPGWVSYFDDQPITHHLAQPGYIPGYKVTYNFTSEPASVPAPGAAVLAAVGLGLVGWTRKRTAPVRPA